jgi:membrane protease YdiL (CAAX protease family)
VIFRGYLQRQFSALSHSLVCGIVLQGVVFGLGHGYQGWKLMALIAMYGICFGVLAHWRSSLRPGIIGHSLQDIAGGLLARFLAH